MNSYWNISVVMCDSLVIFFFLKMLNGEPITNGYRTNSMLLVKLQF